MVSKKAVFKRQNSFDMVLEPFNDIIDQGNIDEKLGSMNRSFMISRKRANRCVQDTTSKRMNLRKINKEVDSDD